MRWGPLLVLAVCACNQAFDLVPTRGTDSDGDGHLDGADNCLLTQNADQQDADHDGLGDACDPCVLGPQSGIDADGDGVDDECDLCLDGANHDEDGDGVADGCDDCPGHPDPSQPDGDGDGVGDACDPATGANTRVMFDSFAPPLPGWNTAFTQWTVTDVGFGPVPPFAARYLGAWHPGLVVQDSGWVYETVVSIEEAPVEGSLVILDVVTDAGGFSNRDCGVRFTQGQWTSTRTGAPVTVGPTLRLRIHELPATTECWMDDVLVSTAIHINSNGSWMPLLEINLRAELEWLDAVH